MAGEPKEIKKEGTNYGVIVSKFNKSEWTHWGYIPSIKYPKTIEISLPLLRKGAVNGAVDVVQLKLGAKVDGKFGSKTEESVKRFQKSRNLESDGIVGENTWREIFR